MPEFKLKKYLNLKLLSLYLLQAETRTGSFTFVSVLNLPSNSSISLTQFCYVYYTNTVLLQH